MIRPTLFILSVLPLAGCLSPRDGGIDLETEASTSNTEEDKPDASVATSEVDAWAPFDGGLVGVDAQAPLPTDGASSTNTATGEDQHDDDTSTTAETTDHSQDLSTANGESTDAGGASTQSDASSAETPSEWAADQTCLYHTPPVPFATQAQDDAGTDAGPPAGPHVTLLDSEYLGSYLADHAGYTLYIYTADLPGNCETAPVSTCFDDCLIAWPIFEAGDRLLGEGLDDAAFGTFVREDGLPQTTYFGWPLYYYKKDLAPEDVVGQGKGKVWYVAETVLPNLLIMRASEEREGVKYLANGEGFTLYTYAGDTLGTETHMPSSACVGACLESYRPFSVRSLRAVTDLEPQDLSVFIRQDGTGQQVSYRGQPLYLHVGDTKSGDMNGLLLDGFELVLP